MLSQRTLRVLMVLSNQKKVLAEQTAADASRRLAALGGQATTLSKYVASLSEQMIRTNINTGYELRSYGRFIEMGIRAQTQNEVAITAGEAAQKLALDDLAIETEKQKALRKTMDQSAAAADMLAARRDDQSPGRSTASRESGKVGRTGLTPPAPRQASSRQT